MEPREQTFEPASMPQEERERLRSNRQALRDLLGDGEWHKNWECAQVGGLSFNGSIYALRCKGWIIETRYVRRGEWEYRLTGKGEPRMKRRLTTKEDRITREYLLAAEELFGDDASERILSLVPPDIRPQAAA